MTIKHDASLYSTAEVTQSGEVYSLKKSSGATLISFVVADIYGIFSKWKQTFAFILFLNET